MDGHIHGGIVDRNSRHLGVDANLAGMGNCFGGCHCVLTRERRMLVLGQVVVETIRCQITGVWNAGLNVRRHISKRAGFAGPNRFERHVVRPERNCSQNIQCSLTPRRSQFLFHESLHPQAGAFDGRRHSKAAARHHPGDGRVRIILRRTEGTVASGLRQSSPAQSALLWKGRSTPRTRAAN